MLLPSAPPGTLRVVSFNIRKCLGLDLRRRPDRILGILDDIGADIAVLQEADRRLPPRPSALPHYLVEDHGWTAADLGGAGSLGWHGNAILTRRDALDIRDTRHIALPGFEPRGAVVADCMTSIGALRVVGVHLGLLAESRRRQLHHLAESLDTLPVVPTVIAGDFNETTPAPLMTHAAPDYRLLSLGPSFPAIRPVRPIDHVAIGPALDAAQSGVYADRPAHVASDHLPIWADLRQKD